MSVSGLGDFWSSDQCPSIAGVRRARRPGVQKDPESVPLVPFTPYSNSKQAKGDLRSRIEPREPFGSDFSDLRKG
ncbi:hypothetical protein ES288_A05G244600v1 [Gossypium darwinii]|uniref:Uncharacterized protein n=1 Tax=Gossypium darwinii TaxID=34276 RepID=A0A5D2GJ19_GOSDA|nr:hypothetical protein ES288_A05G244600v1 [Gossypium darwinii]